LNQWNCATHLSFCGSKIYQLLILDFAYYHGRVDVFAEKNPPAPDPMRQPVMMLLPVFFTGPFFIISSWIGIFLAAVWI
jgi:hypothetical protein